MGKDVVIAEGVDNSCAICSRSTYDTAKCSVFYTTQRSHVHTDNILEIFLRQRQTTKMKGGRKWVDEETETQAAKDCQG